MTGDKIAWAGELELKEAKWTDRDGHLVRFRLVTPNEDRPNPFKAFTKRRGKRAGTRFIASLSHVQGAQTDEIAYNGEFMLAGWGDTSTDGYTVTFWCEIPDVGIHPFEGYTRGTDTFMAALVELDENDMPVNQAKRETVERAAPSTLGPSGSVTRVRGARRLSQYAAMLCQNPDFWAWISQDERIKFRLPVHDEKMRRTMAADWMREVLNIESRRELDENEETARRYHEKIRKPFVAWAEEMEKREESINA